MRQIFYADWHFAWMESCTMHSMPITRKALTRHVMACAKWSS